MSTVAPADNVRDLVEELDLGLAHSVAIRKLGGQASLQLLALGVAVLAHASD